MVFTEAIIDTKKKVNLMGDTSVGKTSLILRFVESVFGDYYLKTIGTNIYTKTVDITGAKIKLIINDIMGEKAYRSVQEAAFMGSTGAIAVVDITRKDTLDNLMEEWLPRYWELADRDNPIVLAVNKYDLEDKEITAEMLDEYSEFFSEIFFTSAKTDINVESCFTKLAEEVAPNLQLNLDDIEDIMAEKDIANSKELMDALLALSSELGKMPYKTREKLLAESGIDKFSLDENSASDLEKYGGIGDKETIEFGKKLVKWYRDNSDEYTAQAIKSLLLRYADGQR